MLICVGAALRVGEAYSLRWRDCQLIKLNDKDNTEVVHMRVLGKHSRGGQREEAYGMFGAVSAPSRRCRRERPGREAGRPSVHRKPPRRHQGTADQAGEPARRRRRPHARCQEPAADRDFAAPRPRAQSRLPRHRQVGAHQPGDDRRLLRPDASAAERRAHRRFPETIQKQRGRSLHSRIGMIRLARPIPDVRSAGIRWTLSPPRRGPRMAPSCVFTSCLRP